MAQNELGRYSMSAGRADHYAACARAAFAALGLADDDNVSPNDVTEAVEAVYRKGQEDMRVWAAGCCGFDVYNIGNTIRAQIEAMPALKLSPNRV